MRAAYLILAHSRPQRLRRLVDAIQAPWADIFIHIDKKAELAPFVEACKGADVHFHEPRLEIRWGGWALTQVQLDMLRAVRSPKYKYYKLLSGDCYPLKSREQIREFLAVNEANCLLFWSRPARPRRWARIDFHHFVDAIPIENFLRRDRFRARPLRAFLRHPVQITYWGLFHLLFCVPPLGWIAKLLPARKRPMKVFGGEMWWCLRDDFVEYLLDFVDRRPDAARYFKYAFPPDEYMIPSILYNSGFAIKSRIIHLNYMKLLTEEVLDQYLDREHTLFARKFDERMLALLGEKLERRARTANAVRRNRKTNRGETGRREKFQACESPT